MSRTRSTLTISAALVAILGLAGCGGDTPSTDATDSPAPESSEASATAPDEPSDTGTAAPSDEGEPPAAEITVTVNELEGGNDRTTMLFERYTAFENAFWRSLAAGEVSAELRSLVTPDALVGIEQGVTTQQHPIGGTVTISPVLGDVTLTPEGITGGVITGCSDQSQLQYEGGATGTTATISADITFGDEGYVVSNYSLGPDAC